MDKICKIKTWTKEKIFQQWVNKLWNTCILTFFHGKVLTRTHVRCYNSGMVFLTRENGGDGMNKTEACTKIVEMLGDIDVTTASQENIVLKMKQEMKK